MNALEAHVHAQLREELTDEDSDLCVELGEIRDAEQERSIEEVDAVLARMGGEAAVAALDEVVDIAEDSDTVARDEVLWNWIEPVVLDYIELNA